ncbi:internal protein [Leptolyngbya phage LPP-1]|uniref:Internal protein n=1 Tax=Leptolyngbya phage LPP-1 TaxID=2996049 RepID=A0A9Y1DYA5_9CAUD|nr:internal protein [Leptolyngbya phage LPP-1]
MAAVPVIGAGVSLIGGLANISAKNKAAEAQRQAITSESYQRAQQQMANDATLLAQQELARQNYQNSTLARLAQFQQAEMALQAQEQMARLNAQQQAYAIQAGALQQGIQGSQQQQQLERQQTQLVTDANARLQQSDQERGNLAEQGTNLSNQVVQALTVEERKQLSLQAAGNLGTSSNEIARDRELIKRISGALATGMNIDRDVLAREMQGMNEEDLIAAATSLGLLDNAANAEAVATNLRIMGIQADAGIDAVNRNLTQQSGAIDLARQQQGVMGQLDLLNAANAYGAQNYSLGVQRALGQTSATQVQNNLAAQYSATRGAGLLDWLNTGVNTYGAISPMLSSGSRPVAQSQGSGYSVGTVNGFGASGLTPSEGAYGTLYPNQIPGDFNGQTLPLRF